MKLNRWMIQWAEYVELHPFVFDAVDSSLKVAYTPDKSTVGLLLIKDQINIAVSHLVPYSHQLRILISDLRTCYHFNQESSGSMSILLQNHSIRQHCVLCLCQVQ